VAPLPLRRAILKLAPLLEEIGNLRANHKALSCRIGIVAIMNIKRGDARHR
jgi:hypothetical protein